MLGKTKLLTLIKMRLLWNILLYELLFDNTKSKKKKTCWWIHLNIWSVFSVFHRFGFVRRRTSNFLFLALLVLAVFYLVFFEVLLFHYCFIYYFLIKSLLATATTNVKNSERPLRPMGCGAADTTCLGFNWALFVLLFSNSCVSQMFSFSVIFGLFQFSSF